MAVGTLRLTADMANFSDRARASIERATETPDSITRLSAYFEPGTDAEDLVYTGGWFERLDGGGDRERVADQITAQDIVAVTTLSVDLPGKVSVRLLEGELGREINRLLAEIPRSLSLQDADAKMVAVGSEADTAWRLLVAQRGVNRVIAGKLLARKRPHLIPVYDAVVRCYLDKPDGEVWERFRQELRRDDYALTQQLTSLHDQAGLPVAVSLLRVLDVLLWTFHRDDHRAGRCRT